MPEVLLFNKNEMEKKKRYVVDHEQNTYNNKVLSKFSKVDQE
jgi:hypothetical protein